MNILFNSVAFTIVIAIQVAALEVEWEDPIEIELIEKAHYSCTKEGRFRHPQQCGGYVECIRNAKEGIFKRKFGYCHGAIFSSSMKACMVEDEDDQCTPRRRSARALPVERRFTDICSNYKNGFFCADCKTVVNCIEGVAFIESCGIGDTCVSKEEFGGAVCYPQPEEKCDCSSPNSFFMDPYDLQMFFFCSEEGGEPDIYRCPGDMEFDEPTQQCKNKNGFPTCTEAGVFAFHDDCTQYYTCIESQIGWVQKPFTCGNGDMYNELTGACEDPCGWDTGKFSCQQEGRFADPLNCSHYYLCVQSSDGIFRQEHRQCPSGYEWNENALSNSGSCEKGHNSNCEPLIVTKCTIPARCPEEISSGTVPLPEEPIVGESAVAPAETLPEEASTGSEAEVSTPFFRGAGYGPNSFHHTFIEFPAGNDQRRWSALTRGDRRSRTVN